MGREVPLGGDDIVLLPVEEGLGFELVLEEEVMLGDLGQFVELFLRNLLNRRLQGV
jgi:hypothetical protein